MLKKLALGALVLMFGLIAPALAADVGGTCCADLEERIAELEATTARKGNRKMSVTITGQIHKSIMWHDLDGGSGLARPIIGDGSQSPTTLGFAGSAKISPDVKAGFFLELGADENRPSGEDIVVRNSNVWIESIKVGRLTLGRGSVATDGIAEITVANTAVAAKMLNLEPVSTQFLFGLVNLPFDGGRRDVVRYDSNSLGGFIVSASWGKGDHVGPFSLSGDNSHTVWDVALRYAGEFGGLRLAAGVGYRNEDYSAVGPLLLAPQDTSITGSASILHIASGLFASGAYGKISDFGTSGSGLDLTGMHGQAGWEKNVNGIGATTLFGEWAQLKADGTISGEVTMIGGGVVQAIDAAAMDLYVSWRQLDLGDLGVDDKVNVIIGGARIKF